MFSFKLNDSFIEPYKTMPVDWGYQDAGGNSIGELTFLRTYSRKKEDGTKERWWEVCRRVVEGMFSLQKDHVKENRLPWNYAKSQKTAQDAYDRLFHFKWSPPGRGLWVMGTPLVNIQKNSAALQNCAFVSTYSMTRENPAAPYLFLMEASMLGIGVGFDQRGAEKKLKIFTPGDEKVTFVIPDSREGWVESLRLLLESYLKPDQPTVVFDYGLVRKAGEPIKIFGGTSAGPEPLMKLHDKLRGLLDGRDGELFNTTDAADIGNLIGVCVVSGNVRRSAELLLGSIDDEEFLALKDYGSMQPTGEFTEKLTYRVDGKVYQPHELLDMATRTPEELSNIEEIITREPVMKWVPGKGADRAEWSWMSNNSVSVSVGDDLSKIVPGIAQNGEPGVVWMDVSRQYGRLADPINNKDHRAVGYNPCAEQTLESYECCTLVETYIDRHDSLEDYKKTLKVAYLYAKSVVLLPTHWPETNAVMQRNRRIGTSISGIANFADNRGMPELKRWMDEGYATVQKLDKSYSEWLCTRESIKTTTVKPSGTVSLLSGSSPGVHWAPGGTHFLRTIRFSKADPMIQLFSWAGYRIETDVANPDTTVVVYFPVKSKAKRSEEEVTLFEKASLAALAQRWWSDNSVSVTLSFDPETEGKHVGTILAMYEGQLKTVSFLPMMQDGAYAQMPYGKLTQADFEKAQMELMQIDFSMIYEGAGVEAIGEAFCSTDACVIQEFKLTAVEA